MGNHAEEMRTLNSFILKTLQPFTTQTRLPGEGWDPLPYSLSDIAVMCNSKVMHISLDSRLRGNDDKVW